MLTFGIDFVFRRPADANPLDLNNLPAGEDHTSRDHGTQPLVSTHTHTDLHLFVKIN